MQKLTNKGEVGGGSGVVILLLVFGVMLTMGLIIQTNFDTAFSTMLGAGPYASQYGNLTANVGNAFLLMTIPPILIGASAVIAYVMRFGNM
jgi:nitrogen fixation protein FixH